MNEEFYQEIFNKQRHAHIVPSNSEITTWALQVIHLLFPEQAKQAFSDLVQLKSEFDRLHSELCTIMSATQACCNANINELCSNFFIDLPELYRKLNTDVQAIFNGDPAARSEFEVIRTYPGFFAISFYRLAHSLFKHDVPLLARLL